MATYHGLIKVSCVACNWETQEDHTMEMLNDLSGQCPNCDLQFFRWENNDGSIVVSLTDQNGNYDNLVSKGSK
jgi:NAD-dependent SIR2 family protein deacetylase